MTWLNKILIIAAGGAVGSILRYTLSGLAYRLLVSIFPTGTLLVNLLGSFLIGLIWGSFELKDMNPLMKNFTFIGLLGGFTTFSTFTLENFHLLRDGEFKYAAFNIIASNVIGILLVFLGYLLSKYLIE